MVETSRDDIRETVLSLLKPLPFQPSTRRTYSYVLTSVIAAGKYPLDNLTESLKNVDEAVLAVQEAYPSSVASRASAYSALYAFTKVPEYRERMMDSSGDVRKKYQAQKLKDGRATGSLEDIFAVHAKCMAKVKKWPLDENGLYPYAAQTDVVNALLTGLVSGYYPELPPRRLEWADTRVAVNETQMAYGLEERKNFTDGERIVFGDHKNAKWKDGPDLLVFPPPLKHLFNQRKLNDAEWLLVNKYGDKFTKSALSERLKKLFGFSVDVLRQTFVSDFNKGMNPIKDMESLAEQMGHSVGTQVSVYTKKNK